MQATTQLKHNRFISLLVMMSLLGLILFECDLAPAEPKIDNPTDTTEWDGGVPDIPPSFDALLVDLEGVSLSADSLIVSWRGNLPTMQFRYRLDANDWSMWATDTFKMVRYLDEGDHLFGLEARYMDVDAAKADTSFSFTVDAISGPSLLVEPRNSSVLFGSEFSVTVNLEEVTTLLAVHPVIRFDSNKLRLEHVEVLSSITDLLRINAGQVVPIVDDTQAGVIDVNLAVAQYTNAAITGSGPILSLTFQVLTAGTHSISFDPISSFISTDLQEISINEMVSGRVEVSQ